MKNYKVRFHLGRGKNYMQWQITNNKTKEKVYASPKSTIVMMEGCELGNRPSVAKKIFEGENKTVCAWISCDDVRVVGADLITPDQFDMSQYKYNPKKNPHWFSDDEDNCDGKVFERMMTVNRQVYG